MGFFNRFPDADGPESWIRQYQGGATLEWVANKFYDAGVLFGVYSPNMTEREFITRVYPNVLGRRGASAPNADEIQAWQNWLVGHSKGAMVLHMLDVSHDFFTNDPNVGWVVELLDNKAEVANVFAVQLGLNLQTPEESIEKGMQIAAAVTPTDTSAALELIGVSTANVDRGVTWPCIALLSVFFTVPLAVSGRRFANPFMQHGKPVPARQSLANRTPLIFQTKW